jgi:hypothetical protein
MNLNTKCKEAAFFVGRWDTGDTHTHTHEYIRICKVGGSNPLLYMCACAAASFLWCRWWIFFFSSFSLGDIFLPLVDLDLKKKIIEKEFFSLPSVCKKELNTAPKEEEEEKKLNSEMKFKITGGRGSLGTLGIISLPRHRWGSSSFLFYIFKIRWVFISIIFVLLMWVFFLLLRHQWNFD